MNTVQITFSVHGNVLYDPFYRYLLTKQDNKRLRLISHNEFLDNKVSIQIFHSSICRDKIHIGKFSDDGLLLDGTFVHSFNNLEGLNRKMN